jgi:hypothetical protein
VSLELLREVDWFFTGLAFLSIALLVWSYYSLRRYPFSRWLLALRLGLMLLLLLTLLQPRVTRHLTQTRPLKWLVYVDNSVSMGYHQSPSLVAIETGVNSLLESLENRGVLLERYQFGGTVQPAASPIRVQGVEIATDLGGVLEHARHEKADDLAGVLLFTDGQPTQGTDPLQVAATLPVPVFVVGVGDTTPLVDVAIQSIDVPTVAIKGEDVEAEVVITSTGTVNERLSVSLSRGRKLIASRFVQVPGGGTRSRVRFRFKPESMGRITYRVQVSSLADEINIQNNRQSFYITILKDRYRIALLTGVPNYNTTLLKRILAAQPRVQLDHFVQYDQTFRPSLKSFWETGYDLIVFDNFPVRALSSQWQRILAKKLVSHKSSLAWVIGPNVTPEAAASLYPFFRLQNIGEILDEEQSYSWSFTERIRELPFLPAGRSLIMGLQESELPPLRPGLQVEGTGDVWTVARLEESAEVPVLVLGEKEELRSAVWTTPDLYQVYYRLTGTRAGELISFLWGGVVSWLMRTAGDRELYFRVDKEVYQQGELITVAGNRIGEMSPLSQAAMTVYRDSVVVHSTELRYNPDRLRWEGQLWAPAPGDYTYEIVFVTDEDVSRQQGHFRVVESQIELNRVFVNTGLLSQIADRTGGLYRPWATRAELAEQIQPAVVTETVVKRTHLNETWGTLMVMVLILAVEWSARRKFGLP